MIPYQHVLHSFTPASGRVSRRQPCTLLGLRGYVLLTVVHDDTCVLRGMYLFLTSDSRLDRLHLHTQQASMQECMVDLHKTCSMIVQAL